MLFYDYWIRKFICDDMVVKNVLSKKLFGVKISQIFSFMDSGKCKLIIKSFMKSSFSFCPPIWMFHNWKNMKTVPCLLHFPH